MPQQDTENHYIAIEQQDNAVICRMAGDWTIDHAEVIDNLMQQIIAAAVTLAKNNRLQRVCFDGAGLNRLDTTGAILVRRYTTFAANAFKDAAIQLKTLSVADTQVELMNVPAALSPLLETIPSCPATKQTEPDPYPWYEQILADVGAATTKLILSGGSLLSFIGLVLIRLFSLIFAPKRLRLIPLMHQIDVVGFRAMGIVGLIAFLIGAVMVNQGAIQLSKFGADIFVIDMLGISHLRELGILLTAIIIAGRSGSAFTAQIGSMKLHEEVDAMTTLGMNPIDVLVLPRVLALVIALPLLTFYADVMGIAGGALMAWAQLDISPGNFLHYFRDVVSIDHALVGLIKAPFFALVIAISGCYEGFRVARSADSLGAHTTSSVVQSIFLVIILDALFAIFFTAVGL